MLTASELKTKIDQTAKVIHDWQEADEPMVMFRGILTKAIDDAVVDAVLDLQEFCRVVEADQEAQRLILKVDEFHREWESWSHSVETATGESHPNGTHAMWIAWADVLQSRDVPERRKPEDIRTLIGQEVGDTQIAKIYGWKDADGRWDVRRVAEEKREPGKHYNPEKWQHPMEVAEREQVARAWENRVARVRDVGVPQPQATAAPESIEELLRQGVGSEQAARMKQISVQEVRAEAARLGIPVDSEYVPMVSPHDQMEAMRRKEAKQNAELAAQMQSQAPQPDADTAEMVTQVLERHLDDQRPGEIAKALKDRWPELSAQKVSAIIKEAEAAPAS